MTPFALSPNLAVVTVIIGVVLYGLVGGAPRLRSLIFSAYMGIVLAQVLSSSAAPYLAFLPADQVALVLFSLPIALFALFSHRAHEEKGSTTLNLLVGLL